MRQGKPSLLSLGAVRCAEPGTLPQPGGAQGGAGAHLLGQLLLRGLLLLHDLRDGG